MTEENFRKFLNRHHSLGYTYKDGGLSGFINVWPYENGFVLTWEECENGNQFNESNYTRDERYQLPDMDAVIAFLYKSGVDVSHFKI